MPSLVMMTKTNTPQPGTNRGGRRRSRRGGEGAISPQRYIPLGWAHCVGLAAVGGGGVDMCFFFGRVTATTVVTRVDRDGMEACAERD